MQKEILEYQRLDRELRKIKREVEKNEFRVEGIKYQTMRNEIETQISSLDAKATDLQSTLSTYQDKYKKLCAILKDYLNLIDDIGDIEEVKYMKRKIQTQLEEVARCEKEIKSLIREAETAGGQYDDLSKKMPVVINNYNKCNAEFKKILAGAQPRVNELQRKMNELEPMLDANLLEVYKKIKNHNIFPVFVPIEQSADKKAGGSCGGCRMEIFGESQNKLEQQGHIKCEHCGRIIFKQN